MDYNYSNSYISNLNLENIESPPDSASNSSNDLSIFTNDEFFNFDVFANDDEFTFKETKPQLQQQFQQQVQQTHEHEEEYQNEQLIKALLDQNNSSGSINIGNFHHSGIIPSTPYTSIKNNNSKPLSTVKIADKSAKITKDSNGNPIVNKRKRNTLASARFRIKKKLKEQKMEQELNELSIRVNELKSTMLKVEMENKCLKNLVVEKNEKKSDDLLNLIKKNAGI